MFKFFFITFLFCLVQINIFSMNSHNELKPIDESIKKCLQIQCGGSILQEQVFGYKYCDFCGQKYYDILPCKRFQIMNCLPKKLIISLVIGGILIALKYRYIVSKSLKINQN